MTSIDCRQNPAWLRHASQAVKYQGFCVVEGVLDKEFIAATRDAMYRAQKAIREEVGEARLRQAGELGVLRLMMKFEPHFFRFLEIPEVLQIVDATVSETAILHLQNGFILPSFAAGADTPKVFQNSYHRDFPRVLNGYLASINVFFAIDEFHQGNGSTWIVPGTHQQPSPPQPDYLEAHGGPVICPAGSMIVFDSTLWHAAGQNTSGKDRLAVNHQFTRSYVKQQIDYVRALGEPCILNQQLRTRQFVGYFTRVVTCLEEYYRPENERLYRRGQG